ncbi:MAG: hypothetical protein OJI67_16320 [Prosthecobacter sp.]|nr:hypothetical protein [Prosthecobacter sp.]
MLTVPSHMAGVTGPCPICGQTITSPNATQAPAPAPVSLFTTPAPQPAQTPSAASAMPNPMAASNLGPVMPMPNSISQHLGPMGNPSPPAQGGGFLGGPTPAPARPEPSTPPWQQPGLGQTLLGNHIPQQPQSAPSSPGNSIGGFGGLPSRRPEGQPPASVSAQPPVAPWGGAQTPADFPPASKSQDSPLFPQRTSPGAPSHSSLIPGSPTLPHLGNPGTAQPAPSSLLSREIPAAAPTPAQAPAPLNLPEARQERPSPTPRSQRQFKKASRSSNIFMFALTVLLLVGCLAAAGWMFRKPIMQVVDRYMPSKGKPVVSTQPKASEILDQEPMTATTPEKAEPSTVAKTAPKTGFDPDEPAPPRAQMPTPEEIAALNAPSLTPKGVPPTTGLLEVPSKPMTPSLQNDKGPANSSSVAMPKSPEVKVEVSEEGQPAADALLKFLQASNLQERLRYTLAANSMKPLMERYYQSQPDNSIQVDAIGLVRFDPKPQLGGGAHAVFGVESRTWEYPVPVMLEQNKDGFQVDWLSFVEFKDRLLEKFFEGYQEGPARFHVGITRTHYFEDKVPNSDNKDAFLVGPAPPNPYQTTVFVEKDSQLGRDLKDRIPWGSQVWAIVELEWVKLGTQQWVQLVGVPQLNWYSVPEEKKPKSGKSSNLPNEIQRAVPVGR